LGVYLADAAGACELCGSEEEKMKFNCDPEFSVGDFEVQSYEGDIDDAGIQVYVPCSCGAMTTVYLTIEEWDEIVRQAKMFRDRRTVVTERKNELER